MPEVAQQLKPEEAALVAAVASGPSSQNLSGSAASLLYPFRHSVPPAHFPPRGRECQWCCRSGCRLDVGGAFCTPPLFPNVNFLAVRVLEVLRMSDYPPTLLHVTLWIELPS